jgi:hypothetical protein
MTLMDPAHESVVFGSYSVRNVVPLPLQVSSQLLLDYVVKPLVAG